MACSLQSSAARPGYAKSLRNARIAAARRDTSVSALVVAYLQGLSDRMDEFGRLEALQHEVQAEIGQFRAADRLGRDEVHDRAVR